MMLYLVQHAEALKEEENPDRPLSGKGREDIGKISSHLALVRPALSRILHSPKLRARQTAEVLAEGLAPSPVAEETDGLGPMDDPGTWEDRLKYLNENVLLVGHLPHLGRLASLLLCGNREAEAVSFRMAGVVCLERSEKGSWSLQWMITPELLP